VVIQVDNKDLKLKPGMTANVSILIEHKEGVLKIPNAALRFRPVVAKIKETGEKGKGGSPQKQKSSEQVKSPQGEKERSGKVWVLSQQGKPTPVSIVLGITDGTFSEMVAGDLREGMEIIVEETSGKKGQSQSSSAPPSIRGLGR
jgi:HlyD family secretion protein